MGSIERVNTGIQKAYATIARTDEKVAIKEAQLSQTTAIMGNGGRLPDRIDANNNGVVESKQYYDSTGSHVVFECKDEDENNIYEYYATYRDDHSIISEEFDDNETGKANKRIYYDEDGEMVLTEDYQYDDNGELIGTTETYKELPYELYDWSEADSD